jgi:adenylate kinase
MDLILFGIQGSGKGTQAKLLAQNFGYEIFEAGAELRKIAATDLPLGNTVAGYIDHGHLVPFAIIMDVVRDAMSRKPGSQKILFDGVPRDVFQMRAFEELMRDLHREFQCMQLTVNEEAAIKRIVNRAKEQGRADDANEEFIRRRIGLFHEKTMPVIDMYRKDGKLIEVNGEGSVDEVFARLKGALAL